MESFSIFEKKIFQISTQFFCSVWWHRQCYLHNPSCRRVLVVIQIIQKTDRKRFNELSGQQILGKNIKNVLRAVAFFVRDLIL